MKMILLLTFLLLCSCGSKKIKNELVTFNPTPQFDVLSFGSCNHEDDPQTIWPIIKSQNPDLWIWMGDNIYASKGGLKVIEKKYQVQKSSASYIDFIKDVPVIGTWDDHDYGMNDGNKSNGHKTESKELMLNFLDVGAEDDRWKREGAYTSHLVGKGDQKVKIILLDTRSFQDVLRKDPTGKARYLTSDGDILGKAQWNWLEGELDKDEAAVHIIVSSIQVLAQDHIYEKWANFPNARNRVLELANASKARNIIFFSGDRHIAEISKTELESKDEALYDITSSGMTHSYKKSTEKNRHRVSDLVVDENFGILKFDWKDNLVRIQCQLIQNTGEVLVDYHLGDFNY